MRTVGWAVLALVSLACTPLTDARQLAAELQARFNQPVGVSITNGSYLTVSVATDSTDTRTDDERRALAFDIAKFAYAHYDHPATVRQVSVRFVATQSFGGASFRRTAVAGSWSPAELRSNGP